DEEWIPYGHYAVPSNSQTLYPGRSRRLVSARGAYDLSRLVPPHRQPGYSSGNYQAIVATASVGSEMPRQARQMARAPALFVEDQRQECDRLQMIPEPRWLPRDPGPRNEEVSYTTDVYEDALEETTKIRLTPNTAAVSETNPGFSSVQGAQSWQNLIELEYNNTGHQPKPQWLCTERLSQYQPANVCNVPTPRMTPRNLNQYQSFLRRGPEKLITRVASLGTFESHTNVENQAQFITIQPREVASIKTAQVPSLATPRSATKSVKTVQTEMQRRPTTATNTERAKSRSTGVGTDIEKEDVGTATASITQSGKSTQVDPRPSWPSDKSGYPNSYGPLPSRPYSSQATLITPHGFYGQQYQFCSDPPAMYAAPASPQPAYFAAANHPVLSAPQPAYPQATYPQPAYPQVPQIPCPQSTCPKSDHHSRPCSPSACCEPDDCNLSPPSRNCSRAGNRRRRSGERLPFTAILPPSLGHTFTVGYVMHPDNELSPVLLPAGAFAELAQPSKDKKENPDTSDTVNRSTQVEPQRDPIEEEVSQECAALRRAVLEQDAKAQAQREKKALRERRGKLGREFEEKRLKEHESQSGRGARAEDEETHTQKRRHSVKKDQESEDDGDGSRSPSDSDGQCSWFSTRRDKNRMHHRENGKKGVHLRVPSKSRKHSAYTPEPPYGEPITATSEDACLTSTKITVPGASSGDISSDDGRSYFTWSTPKSRESDGGSTENQSQGKSKKPKRETDGFPSKREVPEKTGDTSSSTKISSRGSSLTTNSLKAKIRVAFSPSRRTKKKLSRTEARRSTSYDTATSSVAASMRSERRRSSADDVYQNKHAEETHQTKNKSRKPDDQGTSCWASFFDQSPPEEDATLWPAPAKSLARPKQHPRQDSAPVLPPPPQNISEPLSPYSPKMAKVTERSAEKNASSGGSFLSSLIGWFSRGDKKPEDTKSTDKPAPTSSPSEDKSRRKDSDGSFNRWVNQVERASPHEESWQTREECDPQEQQGYVYPLNYPEDPGEYYQQPYINEFGQFDRYPAQYEPGAFNPLENQGSQSLPKSQNTRHQPDESPRWVIRYSEGKSGSTAGSARVSLQSVRGSKPQLLYPENATRADIDSDPDFVIRCVQGNTASKGGSKRITQQPDQDISRTKTRREGPAGAKKELGMPQPDSQGQNLARGAEDLLGEPDWAIRIVQSKSKPRRLKLSQPSSSSEKLPTEEIGSEAAMTKFLKTELPVPPCGPEADEKLDLDTVPAPGRSPVSPTSSPPPLPRKRRSVESFKHETFEVIEEENKPIGNLVLLLDEKGPESPTSVSPKPVMEESGVGVREPPLKEMDPFQPISPDVEVPFRHFDLEKPRKRGSALIFKDSKGSPLKETDTFPSGATPNVIGEEPRGTEADTTTPSKFGKLASDVNVSGGGSPPKEKASITSGELKPADIPEEGTKKALKAKKSKEPAVVFGKKDDGKGGKKAKASGSKASKASASKGSTSKKPGAKALESKASSLKAGSENLPTDDKKRVKDKKKSKSHPALKPPGGTQGAIGSGDPVHTLVLLEPVAFNRSEPLSYDCPTGQELCGYAILTAVLVLGLMLLVSVPRMSVH
ncbi:unnamed protein product, partial [Ixodes hexagonus]